MKARSIVCPQCGSDIQLDTSTYDNLASQIREQVVSEAVSRKEAEMNERLKSAVQYERSQAQVQIRDAVAKKDGEIVEMRATLEDYKRQANEAFLKQQSKYQTKIAQGNSQITSLQKEIEIQNQAKESAVAQAISVEKDRSRQKDAEIADLRQQIAVMQEQESGKIGRAVAAEKKKASDKDAKISLLSAQLEAEKNQSEMRIKTAVSDHEKTEAQLREKISSMETSRVESEKAIQEKNDLIIKELRDEVAYYKDFKSRLSTKGLGESLEVACSNAYEKIRPLMGDDYFAKDNDVSKASHSKADFIWRYIVDGREITSVCFEMKTQSDETDPVNMHKNSDFFKELDKDRREKNCEYAVLCSQLEPDSELYNQGIVDVSHQYEKMIVIRPQFFIPLIMIIRNLAQDNVSYIREIQTLKDQTIDVTNFSDALDDFKNAIARNYEMAAKKKDSAIAKIDKTIDLLQQVKSEFEAMDKHLLAADNKAQKMTIKKLTKNAPSVAALIDRATEEKKESTETPADREEDTDKNAEIKKAV